MEKKEEAVKNFFNKIFEEINLPTKKWTAENFKSFLKIIDFSTSN